MPKKSSRPLRIFLCHASSDKPKVRELYQRLSADGFDVWLDEVKLMPGDNWREKIPAAVEDTDIVLACLSSKSINKEGYIQKEIAIALDEADEKPEGIIFIIPVKLEECEVPRRLRRWQWVDLFSEDGYQKLTVSLLGRAKNLGLAFPAEKPRKSESHSPSRNIPFPDISISSIPIEKEPGPARRIVLSPPRSTSARLGLLATMFLLVVSVTIGLSQLGYLQFGRISSNTPTSGVPGSDSDQPIYPKTTLEPTRMESASSPQFTSTSLATLAALTPRVPFSSDAQAQTTTDVVQILLQDGKSVFVASNWMLYSGGGSNFWDLLTEFKFQNRGSISFSDIKSIDFGEAQTNDYSVTMELLSGEKIEDKLDTSYAYGSIIGVMNGGEFKATFSEIKRMDFKQTADKPIAINMATVVNSAGEEIKAPADLLEAAFTGSSMAGPYTYVRDGWTLEDGMLAPFKLMKGFEFDENTDSSGPTIVYTLLDGRTLTNRIDTTDSPTLRGITELGTFHLNRANIKRVDFHRNNTQVLPLMTTLQATMTLQTGVVYKIPAYWLAFKSSVWKNSFSVVGCSNMFFNEVKSLKIQVGDDISTVTASIELLNNQTITGKMRMSGYDKLVGIDTQGNFVEVSLQDVNQISFEQGFTPPAGISMAIITTSGGTQIQVPLNSVKLLLGGSSWGYYSYSYTDEIALTTGIKVPFSKIKKFDVGTYDTKVSRFPVTIYLTDGQVINSYFENSLSQTFAISGFTESGLFQMDVDQIQTVNFNR